MRTVPEPKSLFSLQQLIERDAERTMHVLRLLQRQWLLLAHAMMASAPK